MEEQTSSKLKEINKSFKESQENNKIEIDAINKTQSEGILEIEILGK